MRADTYSQLVKDWGELEAAGIPLEPFEYRAGIDHRRAGDELIIKQEFGDWVGEIRELKNFYFNVILPVFILRNLPGKTIIRDMWLDPPPWDASSIEWLGDPAEEAKSGEFYSLPRCEYKYPRKIVLNHRIRRVLSRGDILEGLLLGVGFGRPPETYPHKAMINIKFNVLDQWEKVHPVDFELPLYRCLIAPKPLRDKARVPLFTSEELVDSEPCASLSRKRVAKKRCTSDRWGASPAQCGLPDK